MARVEQIETTIRGDKFFSRSTQFPGALRQFIHIDDF
jgi:hypothetical protein